MKRGIWIFSLIIFGSKATRQHYLGSLLKGQEYIDRITGFVLENTDVKLREFLNLTPKGPFRDLLELEYRRVKLCLDPNNILPVCNITPINFFLFVINKMRKRLYNETSIEKYDLSLNQILYFDQYIQFFYKLTLFHMNNSLEYINRTYRQTLSGYLKKELNNNRLAIIMTFEKYNNNFQSVVLTYKSHGVLLPDHHIILPPLSLLFQTYSVSPPRSANIKTRRKLILYIHRVINTLILCLIKTCCNFNKNEGEVEEAEKRAFEEHAESLSIFADMEIDKFIARLDKSIYPKHSCSCEEGKFVVLVGSDAIYVTQIQFFIINFPLDAPPVTCSLKKQVEEPNGKVCNKFTINIYLSKPNDYRIIAERLISCHFALKYREELEEFIRDIL